VSIPKNRVCKLNPAHEDLLLYGPSLKPHRLLPFNSPAQPRISYIKLMASLSSNTISEYGSNESLHDLLPAFSILNLRILAFFRSCFLFIIANSCPEGRKQKWAAF
jgi:hypothetical protein